MLFEAIFWISTFIIFYTYFFYPLILYILVKFRRGENVRNVREDFFQTVSMVISVYNEEKIIERKIENSLELDYPRELIKIVIGSDGSMDRTNELAARYTRAEPRVKLFEFQTREGKASLLNKIIPRLSSDIIIFSDGDTMYEKSAIKNIVRHFSDSEVGGVCGKLVLAEDSEGGCFEEGLYWNYENRIKELESSIKTIAGINGQIFAIRRELFEEIPEDSITEDQVLGMSIIGKGYDILFEPNAICTERVRSTKGEFLRRTRISAGNFQSIALSKDVLNPKAGFASFALWSHKILRWTVPFLLIAIFIANLFLLDNLFFKATLITQIFFYLLSLLYYVLNRIGYEIKIFRTIFYFNLMTLSVLVGFAKFITNSQKVTWQKTS